jgi:hypothetical protein
VADILDILTLAEAKLALNLSGTTSYDSELPAWITGVSRLLDSEFGPVVRRTITGETHDGGYSSIRTRLRPVTSFTSVTEYVSTTGTALTVETNALKPASAYFADTYDRDPTLFSGRIRRRASGSDTVFATGSKNVAVTYVAGRFADTAGVDERFKGAARLTLAHMWMSQRPSLAQVGEFEVPTQQFPRWAMPNAVREMLADEWQWKPLVA